MATYDPANNFEVRVRDIEYRPEAGEAGLARIYQPSGKGPFPALIYVHGGAWSQGSRTESASLNQQLAASGMMIIAIDFRLAPQHPYPAQVADFNFAVRWLKAHAAEFNADPHCVGAVGASTGGHTAVLSGMRPHDPRYCALAVPGAPAPDATVAFVIALWPVLDPYARYLYALEKGRQELVAATRGYFLTEEVMHEGNPQLLLDRGEVVEHPPLLVIQGTADHNIPLSIPKRFARSYRIAGGEVDLEFFPNMPHGFAGRPGPETHHAVELMKKWLARQFNQYHRPPCL